MILDMAKYISLAADAEWSKRDGLLDFDEMTRLLMAAFSFAVLIVTVGRRAI